MRVGVSLPIREMTGDFAAIKDFAQAAEDLGLTHLRIPDQIMRPGSGYVNEPMMLLSNIAAVTKAIELVPSVIILPARDTVYFAKQAAELDNLSEGRLRLGVGIGSSEAEYGYLGKEFSNRGHRCSEQMRLLQELWVKDEVNFSGVFHNISGAGLNPLPIQRPIPMWIGGRAIPSQPVVERIGQISNGWFVLCSPNDIEGVRAKIAAEAIKAGRSPDEIGEEAGVAVVGEREHEWKRRVKEWKKIGLSHLCLRTLGGGLKVTQHVKRLQEVIKELPETLA